MGEADGTHHSFAGAPHPCGEHSWGLDSGCLGRKRTKGIPAGLATGREVCSQGTLPTVGARSMLPSASKPPALSLHQEMARFCFTSASLFLSLVQPITSRPPAPRTPAHPDLHCSSPPRRCPGPVHSPAPTASIHRQNPPRDFLKATRLQKGFSKINYSLMGPSPGTPHAASPTPGASAPSNTGSPRSHGTGAPFPCI